MSELITDEMVEAAARAQYEGRVIELDQEGGTDWDALPESWREEWREGARTALEAAVNLPKWFAKHDAEVAARALRTMAARVREQWAQAGATCPWVGALDDEAVRIEKEGRA